MEEDSNVPPMEPIRDVLHNIERELYKGAAPKEPPCPRCNDTGTELIFNEILKTTSARKCSH